MKTFLDTDARVLYQEGEVWELGKCVNVPRSSGGYTPGYIMLGHATGKRVMVVLEDMDGTSYGTVNTKWVNLEDLEEL